MTRRRLRILSIAFALAAIRDDAVGGAEHVLAEIDRGLAAAGHESFVVALSNSQVHGTLIATARGPEPLDRDYYRYRYFEHRRKIREALQRYEIDLVHMHGYDFHEFIPECNVPVLATLHLPLNWYPNWIYHCGRPKLYMNCVSAAQRREAPHGAQIVSTIENGIRIPNIEPLPASERSGVVVLGRICPEKGTHLGIAAARGAGVPLTIAGRVFSYPEHIQYFTSQIAPALQGNIKLVGAVGDEQKIELLRSARCVLVPSVAPETSSLVSMEALSCGTPVIARNSGALPEIVEHNKTGFVVKSTDEMADAIARVSQIDPQICRRTAMERFSSERMVSEYLDLYHHLLEFKTSHKELAEQNEAWRTSAS